MRVGRAAVVSGITMVLLGCGFEPENARPVEPLPEYAVWFRATEVCSGRPGRFERIQWFAVPGRDFECPTGRCVARWEPGHKVYIAEFWLGAEMVVRHEMLHDLLGEAGHPDPPFGSDCRLTWDSWRTQSAGQSSPLPVTID